MFMDRLIPASPRSPALNAAQQLGCRSRESPTSSERVCPVGQLPAGHLASDSAGESAFFVPKSSLVQQPRRMAAVQLDDVLSFVLTVIARAAVPCPSRLALDHTVASVEPRSISINTWRNPGLSPTMSSTGVLIDLSSRYFFSGSAGHATR